MSSIGSNEVGHVTVLRQSCEGHVTVMGKFLTLEFRLVTSWNYLWKIHLVK